MASDHDFERPSVELGTDFPVVLGGSGTLEVGPRIRLGLGVGFLPRAYVQASNAIVLALFPEDYDRDTATLIENSLSSSLVARASAGWRPSARHGFALGVGTTILALGGSATGAELLAAATGSSLPADPLRERWRFDGTVTVVQLDVTASWDIPVAPRFAIRPSIGWSYSAFATASLEPAFEPRPAAAGAMDGLARDGEAHIEDAIRAYVHPPRVGVAVVWIPGRRQRDVAEPKRDNLAAPIPEG